MSNSSGPWSVSLDLERHITRVCPMRCVHRCFCIVCTLVAMFPSIAVARQLSEKCSLLFHSHPPSIFGMRISSLASLRQNLVNCSVPAAHLKGFSNYVSVTIRQAPCLLHCRIKGRSSKLCDFLMNRLDGAQRGSAMTRDHQCQCNFHINRVCEGVRNEGCGGLECGCERACAC